jgi:hypothetical protein
MGQDSKQRVVTNIQACEGEAFEIKPLNGKSFILGGDNYVCLSIRRSSSEAGQK